SRAKYSHIWCRCPARAIGKTQRWLSGSCDSSESLPPAPTCFASPPSRAWNVSRVVDHPLSSQETYHSHIRTRNCARRWRDIGHNSCGDRNPGAISLRGSGKYLEDEAQPFFFSSLRFMVTSLRVSKLEMLRVDDFAPSFSAWIS